MREKRDSFLERSLSLSKNGGISGEKTEADGYTAVLLVGLGGAGADALLQIKNQISREVYNENVEYLEIDTDESVAKTTYSTTCFSETEQEFCDISVDSLQNMLNQAKEAKRAGEECWQWLDEDMQIYGERRRAGACGIRQIGRMQLFMNIDKVISRISSKIQKLLMKQPLRLPERLVISVCSGISGGTGSGIILDMAYILRRIATAVYPGNLIIMGYVLMPDAEEMRIGRREPHRTVLRANSYACLKEVDYYTRTGEPYCQSFPNGFKLNMEKVPFDYLHLINAKDAFGNSISYTKIWKSVAKKIMTYVIGAAVSDKFGTDILSLYETKVFRSYTYPYGEYKKYISLGISEIKIPCTEIRTLFISRVFEILDRDVFRNRPTEDQFNLSVSKDLEMTEEHIRSALYKNVTVSKPCLDTKNYRYADVWQQNNKPYQDVHNWLALFQKSVMSGTITLPAYLEEKLKEFIERNLRDNQIGPFYLRHFMKSQSTYCLCHMLEGFRRYCFELQQKCACKSKELKNDMQQAFAEGANAIIFNRKKALERYLKTVEMWYRNEECAFLNEKLVEILGSVQSKVELYYEKILQPLTDTLWQVSEICAENVRYLQTTHESDWIIHPLEFEKFQEKKFYELVGKAANDFGEYLYRNLHEWIGRDIDNICDNSEKDIAQSLRNFMYYENLHMLGYENIENCIHMVELNKGTASENYYIVNLLRELFAEKVPVMDKETSTNHSHDGEFIMFYIPADAQVMYNNAKEFLQRMGIYYRNVWSVQCNVSDRIFIIKGNVMTSLSANTLFVEE